MTTTAEAPSVTEFVEGVLTSRATRAEKVLTIAQAWEGDLVNVGAVEVIGAMVAVERVEVHGLIIELDANGNAVTVSSPYGFLAD